ncbi:MAG: (p)ppGpp synthetase, partial [Patescibacteria group bacterium]
METLSFVAEEKMQRIAKETMEVYVPIAERLGIGIFRTKLDDLAFKAMDPKGYAESAAVLQKRRSETEKALDEVLKDIKTKLAHSGLRKFRTEMRVKGVHSFSKKLAERDGHIDKVYDLFALRIIVPTVEDCYQALGLIHGLWQPVPGRVKDYIATPKPNGYRSLHTAIISRNITVEIQIRTEEMHLASQYGAAAHFSYKAHGSARKAQSPLAWFMNMNPIKKSITAEPPKWLKDLASAVDTDGHDMLGSALAEDFFAARMFVFTPRARSSTYR